MSLGPDQPFAPPPPTWREHLRALGHPLDTDDEIERACIEHDLPLEELDVRLNGFGWEDRWDNLAGPQAKAHYLLKDLDLGQAGSALRQAGQIIFEELANFWLEKQVALDVIIYISAPAVRRCEALGACPCFRRALAARSLLSYTAGGAGGTR